MLGVGAAGGDVDVVVEPAGFAGIETGGRIVAAHTLAAAALRWPSGSRLHGQTRAHVVHYGILHCDLQPPPFAGQRPDVEGIEDRHGHQLPGPVSPKDGPSLIGGRSDSPVTLIGPPAA